MGRPPRECISGDTANVKLTTNEDFARAEALRMAATGDVRTGNGFDVHAFADGDHIMLGGVRIAHTRGVTGHSDADVALHALVDAILGALAEGDIGQQFPPVIRSGRALRRKDFSPLPASGYARAWA